VLSSVKRDFYLNKSLHFCAVKKISIRRLWLLVGCCLVGINAFQGYWLWSQYKDGQRNFAITVQGALVQATQQLQLASITRMLPQMELNAPIGMNIKAINIDFRASANAPADTTMLLEMEHDDNNLASISVQAVDSLFASELQKRGITEKYTLDTFQQSTTVSEFPSIIGLDTVIKSSDQKTKGRMVLIDLHETPSKTGTMIEAIAPLNIERKIYIKASFNRHNYHILSGIAGALAVSLLLALLTAGAFFYLLYIIQQQKRLAVLKDDFISAMTHELQTPIATASAAVEALQHFNALENPVRTKEYLQIAQNQLVQLSGMVDQTLSLAAEERNGFQINPRPVDLNHLIPALLQRIEFAADRPVQLHFDNQINASISADPEYLTQALQNLIENAIKYCPTDRTPDIQIRAAAMNLGYKIEVKDNGDGIPELYRDKLFDRFYRAPLTNNIKGFGLGLYVVQRIAEGHGGKAYLQASNENGSIFALDIPTKPF
jgi:two-component system, OmpR family, phosphate regulon sensor histidine kinase PhoR